MIVTDKEHAKFYIAYNGEINELVDQGIHPDPEDIKLASGGWRKNIPRKGKLVKSPRGLEGIFHAFAKKVRLTSLKIFKNKSFANVFLYAPHHYQPEIRESLHPYVIKKLTQVIDGDFIHAHPIELVERVR